MRRRRGTVLAAAAVVALAGCGLGTTGLPEPGPGPPQVLRTDWQLGHRIPASSGLRVVSRSVSAYQEATRVAREGDGPQDGCAVSAYPAGSYGPENRVGEKVAVRVAGRPGVRDGAGAEGPYLMWQQPDQSWAEVSCYPDEDLAVLTRIAEAVVWKSSSIALPFDLTALPAGYGVHSIDSDVGTGATSVRVGPPTGEDAAQPLLVSFDGPFGSGPGRPVDVGGRTATLSEDARNPGLCFVEQGHQVCVGAEPSDTGPYPDRSAEVPTVLALAAALRFPADLDDRSSWFPAEDVFG